MKERGKSWCGPHFLDTPDNGGYIIRGRWNYKLLEEIGLQRKR
ncbi:MAG: hypothetical protein QXN78_05710 [Conexivisphaerales archaeon]